MNSQPIQTTKDMKAYLPVHNWKLAGIGLFLLGICGATFYSNRGKEKADTDWRTYGGDPTGSRYSELSQINLNNVKNLKLAWTYDTGENKPSDSRKLGMQCQPIVVNGILYGTTPQLKVFAAEAATGKELWKFDPFAEPGAKPAYHPVRGVVYWEEGNDKRILHAAGSRLYAINALTGAPIQSFGT